MTTIPGHIKAKRQKLKETQPQFGKRFGKPMLGTGRVQMDVRPLNAGPLPGAEIDLQQARGRKPDVPLHPLRSGSLALIRYIGHPKVELNEPLRDDWAVRVAQWLADGTEMYFFCHCPDERRSPGLCRDFQARLERLADVPPLPWDGLDEGMEQARMF
jgi:hypothetical protein